LTILIEYEHPGQITNLQFGKEKVHHS